MSEELEFEIPKGFEKADNRGPFTSHNGPTYRGVVDGHHLVGLHVLPRHCNSLGFLHGGMASAFADGAMAWAVWRATHKMSVTLKLAVEYFETVRLGDWLTARAEATPVEGGIVFTTAKLYRQDHIVAARADGVFRTLRRRPAS